MEHLTFHHGGRFGDCIAALYAVEQLCAREGKKAHIILSDFHAPVGWDEGKARSLLPFLETMPYVERATFVPYKLLDTKGFDYDLHAAEDMMNPQDFPEYDGSPWPGNVHLAKRYAHYFGFPFNPEHVWIPSVTVASWGPYYDVVFHAPLRRTVDQEQLRRIVAGVRAAGKSVCVLGDSQDYLEWQKSLEQFGIEFIGEGNDWNMTKYLVSVAQCFLGAVSSVQMLAEAMKKPRFVQVAQGCNNIYAQGVTGHTINGMEPEKVVELILHTIQ